MGLVNATLKGGAWTASKLGNAFGRFTDTERGATWFSRPSRGISSSEFVPRIATARGAGVVTALALGAEFVGDVISGASGHSLGKVSYADGMSKMTKPFTTGVVEAMHEASQGNYEIFSDMAEEVIKPKNLLSKVDDFGANPRFISALYNMR